MLDKAVGLKAKYGPSVNGYKAFCFPNSETKFRTCLEQAFAVQGKVIAEVQYEMLGMMTWVLCTDGTLWLHDKSHGGGGCFSLSPSKA